MQRMHYVMHYVMHRVLAKMGWPSLDRVLSKMAEASLRSYSKGSYKPCLLYMPHSICHERRVVSNSGQGHDQVLACV